MTEILVHNFKKAAVGWKPLIVAYVARKCLKCGLTQTVEEAKAFQAYVSVTRRKFERNADLCVVGIARVRYR